MTKVGALLVTASTGDPTQLSATGDLFSSPIQLGQVNPSGGPSPAILSINRLATNETMALSGGYNTLGVSSWHVGGAQAVLGDGSVRFLTDNIDDNIWLNLCRKADGASLGAF